MVLADFKIRQLVFEIRYDEAFFVWDRAGSIAEQLVKIWPGAKMTEGEPNKQTLKNVDASVSTGLQSSHIAITQPSSIGQFSEQIEATLNVWVSSLEIKKFERIGTRVMYIRSFTSADAAQKALVELGLVRYPKAPIFNHKTAPKACDLRLYWEEEFSQTQILLKTEHQQVLIEGLANDLKKKEKRNSDVVLMDIDRATRGTVELSKFHVSEWLEGVRHIIYRDVDRVLNPI